MSIGENNYELPTPKEIKVYLDERIIGQDIAKEVLSVEIYNHYKRMIIRENLGITLDKGNILISGPTGCGKTSIIKAIAEKLNVPCYVADSTSITQAGYVGDDVESLLLGLLRSCNYNIKLAQYGIVVLDEVDKLAKSGANQHITRDVVGEGVQQALLKMVEGGIVGVPAHGGRKHPEQDLLYIDTTNILFIGLGAFNGLEDIIRDRINADVPKARIGFCAEDEHELCCKNFLFHATADDYKKFGMIPEFIGRFPILTFVDNLDSSDLKDILAKPKNSIISQFQLLFRVDGIDLQFTDGALTAIAKYASETHTGARGLRNAVSDILQDYMFNCPGSGLKSVKIDKKCVDKVLGSKNRA